jgi:hypothetical protein
MNMEEVEVFTTPAESPQKKFMQLGEAGLAADQEAPPNQRAHIPKHHSELIKFCHLSSLPDIPRKPHRQTPGFFRSLSRYLQRASDPIKLEGDLGCWRAANCCMSGNPTTEDQESRLNLWIFVFSDG